jgi:diaminopropionate ammonia-lyase
VAAIVAERAKVTEVAGAYDEAARLAAEAAAAVDAVLVQDTAWPGHGQIPGASRATPPSAPRSTTSWRLKVCLRVLIWSPYRWGWGLSPRP